MVIYVNSGRPILIAKNGIKVVWPAFNDHKFMSNYVLSFDKPAVVLFLRVSQFVSENMGTVSSEYEINMCN